MPRRPVAALLLVLLVMLGSAGPAGAQEITARLVVLVTDPPGGPLERAGIVMESPSRAMSRLAAATGGKGRALWLSLPPAPGYVLEISKEGLPPYRAEGVELQAGMFFRL